jgi:hypothetical protein
MPGSRVRVPPLLFSGPPFQTAVRGFSVGSRVPHRAKFARGVIPLVLILGVAACQAAQARPGESDSTVQQADSVVVLAAGDLVCGTTTPPNIPCLHVRAADLVRREKPDALLLLGDLQYETGSLEDFSAYYDPAFGEFKAITYPVPGNHEYFTRGATGYFDYFNGVGADSGRAGSRKRGYYSFDLGSWHIVALNSNCPEIGGCGARSAQAQWLRSDLAANPRTCTMAFMHSARFSSGEHGNDELMRDLWQVLYEGGADLVLAGHDHIYERFRPQDANGRADAERGLRSFVLGTGGKGLGRTLRSRPNSELSANSSIGWLRLTLRPTDYSWRFISLPGLPLADSGSTTCEPQQ